MSIHEKMMKFVDYLEGKGDQCDQLDDADNFQTLRKLIKQHNELCVSWREFQAYHAGLSCDLNKQQGTADER